ncbi:hypothetical protein K6W12_28250 [Burkholderia multivorans]|uniref:hypothetical protein n=1 Tax=Burkholderia multivorans TaxID=87883 RepID=UPI001C9716FD|nr:hypothetical protein [Burkholderia multivorans]MBY4674519.1 hypothetical protein [Burkholderia multivorans]
MTTTDKSRADALTETPKEAMDRLHREFSAMSPFEQRMWLMRHTPSPISQPAAAPIDVEAHFIAEHGHRLAQLFGVDAFDIADRDAQIMEILRRDTEPPVKQPEPCAHDYVRRDRVCIECGEKTAAAPIPQLCGSCGNYVAIEADHEEWCSYLGWKKRALEAEALNRKFMKSVNGPMHMGEPVIPAPSPADERATKEPDAMTKAVKQLADWLLTEPNEGNPLCFAGAPEPFVLGLSRVKMRSVAGDEWTLIAGLQEGWLTAEQRAANFWRIAKLEREEVAREESVTQYKETRARAAASPAAEAVSIPMATPALYFYGDHEHGFECPDDAAIVSGQKLGDRFTLTAAWYADVLFEVTKVPDEESDDYEVQQVAAPQPPAQAAEPVAQWQYRIRTPGYDGDWHNCNPETAKRLQEHPYAEDHDVRALYAAPQPAQADAREGLTDEQREAIEYAARWLEENVSNRYAYTATKQLRALLNGANHAE